FRWLIRTTGPQPSVEAENRHRGTRAWRLPGPARDVGGLAYGAVTGYVATPTITPGQVQQIYVTTPGSGSVRIRVCRIGRCGGAGVVPPAPPGPALLHDQRTLRLASRAAGRSPRRDRLRPFRVLVRAPGRRLRARA